jgi:plasmid stabilization system protein ParE
MAYQVYFTKQADSDIDSILDYIAQDSPENAIRFIDTLQQRIEATLSIAPHGGSSCGDANYISFENYVVVYDIDEMNKAVYVLMVSEGHRQWQLIFSERQ